MFNNAVPFCARRHESISFTPQKVEVENGNKVQQWHVKAVITLAGYFQLYYGKRFDIIRRRTDREGDLKYHEIVMSLLFLFEARYVLSQLQFQINGCTRTVQSVGSPYQLAQPSERIPYLSR